MQTAIEEAKLSLREGNNGFGAVIIKDHHVIAQSHDTEETDQDPTSHAEINAIKSAAKKMGKNLKDCILISTHEPCPMCATAIVWSKINNIIFGYSILDSIKDGRSRINLKCEDIFHSANVDIQIEKWILKEECSLLYNRDVRNEINKLRKVTKKQLEKYNKESKEKRLHWFMSEVKTKNDIADSKLEAAYKLLLKRFEISEEQMPIVQKCSDKIVFHSKNFCPTLEACKILNLDTRYICKNYNEDATEFLIKQIDPRLKFTRNYNKLRPFTEYCEEMIILEN